MLLDERIPIYYSPKMQALPTGISPSAGKPMDAIASWFELGLGLSLIMPTPATRADLIRAHDPDFVDAILECRALNGFGTRAADVAASLPYTTGAMICAAREAIRNELVAVAPASGFHHAGYSTARGFCTFNGLMVTALALKTEGLAQRVGILDFDQHWGDGTADIIRRLDIDFVTHVSSAIYTRESEADGFLQRIPELVASMSDCQVILYQAGVDPHVNDELGGGWLTTEQLEARDWKVFEAAKELSIPVAWCLAGGYQSPLQRVLVLHDNTMRACAATYCYFDPRFRN